ncbi:MAG: helix-turn-helix transcriptional regulator, partial [Treponema sp.]|nr:helix-turn-helix transcriptional regulator [Treponema sp.]
MPENFFHGYTPIAAGNQIYLERPRIEQLLEKAIQNPIVTVVAGAGYGKTCAVYSFARKYNVRTAWIQCSEWDNAAERFWENFISAVSVISKETAEKLRQIEFPATEQRFDQFLKITRNDIVPNIKYILVYDDLHLITDRTVLRFLEQSIKNLFPNITTILISRQEPAFKLTKQTAKKDPVRITENELRFSRNEMVDYLRLQHINTAPET